MSQPERSAPSLAEKIDHLFRTVRPPKGEYSYQDVATAMQDSGGPTISATYVWQLRRGIRDNPTMKHLEALAQFFGVAPSYFFREDAARKIEAELAMVTAIRDPSVRNLALRSAELSPDGVTALTAMLEQIARLEAPNRPKKRGPRPKGSKPNETEHDTA